MDRRMMDYLPPVFWKIREFSALMAAEQPEIESAWEAADDLLDNQFIASSGELGVSRWEMILGVSPKATQTLDERKFAVLARLNSRLPYTITELKKQLSALCGEDGYSVEPDYDDYILRVELALTAKNNYTAAEALLSELAPANLTLRVGLKYNRHLTFAGWAHGEMSTYTHYNLRNEVI